MKVVEARTKKEQRKYLRFRRELYRKSGKYVDNYYAMLVQLFDGSAGFARHISICAVYAADDNGSILCQGLIAYSKQLPGYIQLCFFESLPDRTEAVRMLLEAVKRKGRDFGCARMVIGLYGHVNYGLGLLDSDYDRVNTFSSPGNEKYYNDYFRALQMEEVSLHSYRISSPGGRYDRFKVLLDQVYSSFEFRTFDKKQFDFYLKAYTDLNNRCFSGHRYYYHREYEDDREMLKELFLFMQEDSLIFAFRNGEPVAFIMWYPDFNELAKPGEAFGLKHFFRNLIGGRKITAAKVMEFGVLEKYRGTGLVLALVYQLSLTMSRYGCRKAVTSWVLDGNMDSVSICSAFCDGSDRKYVVYEQTID